jgi:cell division protease FtsH
MRKQQKTVALWLVVLLTLAMVMKVIDNQESPVKKITYSKFVQELQAKRVTNITFKGADTIIGNFNADIESGAKFEVIGSTGEETFALLKENGIYPNYAKEEKQGLVSQILINWFPMILLFVIFYFFLRQIQGGSGKAMSFGKSKAKMLNENDKKVTFADVSGIEEAKEELVEVVDFLKEPKKYTVLGGKIPKGVLLVGPPGTGKTLLARAVAGEAGVPFFSISGSDFVEMFVGVGASRVRDLFEQGKKNAPCIIFIDEIDAVGRHRGAGLGGGHDEREQTLNQMLVEMDGFEANEGVIIMAATNRVDVLDPALLRPGRFDRRVTVGRPDVRGRLGILKVHSRKSPLSEEVDLELIAKGTPGFTGADLANLVNEAALLAARSGKKSLHMIDFEDAKDKVLMGVARTSMVISDREKRVTAYHEAGHTLVGMKLPETDPIHKVSIIPRGGALGVTQTLPNEDMLNLTSRKANNFIAFLLGGRIAEEIIFDEMTNGASNDIERATDLAKSMVCEWGMSKALGPINYSGGNKQPHNVYGQSEASSQSAETQQSVDGEIKRIILENYDVARKILEEDKQLLIDISEALILWETLDSKQVQDIMDGKDIGVPIIEIIEEKKDDEGGTTETVGEAEPEKETLPGDGEPQQV